MSIDKKKIIEFIRAKGPCLPVDLVRQAGTNTIIIGAVLSELIQSGQLIVSNVKVGGSPLYLVPEHKYKLQEYASHLNEKDRQAYDLLRQRLVLHDKELTPLLRVSMRQIKDYAKQVTVSADGTEELFWRWYLTQMKDAEGMIRSYFEPEKPKEEKGETRSAKREDEDAAGKEASQNIKKEEPRYSREEKDACKAQEPPKVKDGPKEKDETFQKKLAEDVDPGDDFHKRLKDYFERSEIEIFAVDVIRKNQEIEYLLDVPSAIGKIRYFCRAKSKKKINDGDIASAFVAGQTKKLPVLLIATGELGKKTQESIRKDYPSVIFKNI